MTRPEQTAGSASRLRALPAAVRWTLVPLATVGGWIAGVLVSITIGRLIYALVPPATLARVLPDHYRLAFMAAAGAMGWVSGALVAPPRRRWIAAVALFGIGAWVAWALLGWWYFPEGHPRAYQTSLIPVMGAWLGGLLATLLIVIRDVRSIRSSERDTRA